MTSSPGRRGLEVGTDPKTLILKKALCVVEENSLAVVLVAGIVPVCQTVTIPRKCGSIA